jgi:hypothetical protein
MQTQQQMLNIELPAFDPELALVTACSRWPFGESVEREIRTRAALPIDWIRFLSWVRRNRIAPLVYYNLRQTSCPLVPDDVFAGLQSEAAQNARRALMQIAEAARITQLLAVAGIRSMVIKGPVLSALAYGDPALRQSHDIDLLVDPDQVLEVDRLIAQAGYRRITPDVELTPPRYELYRRWRCQSGYYLDTFDVFLELHWRLTSNSLLMPPDAATSCQQIRVAGTTFDTLPDEQLFLYLCVHGSGHMWFRLKWLADIAALLHRLRPEVIERIASRAQTLGLDRPVHVALILAHGVMAAPVRSDILNKAHRNRAARRLAYAGHRALTWHGSPTEPSETLWFNTWLCWHAFQLKPGIKYQWRELQTQMCSPEDWARVRLPEQLFFLYLPLRPLSWLMRKIQRIASR